MEYINEDHLFQISCINGDLKLIKELTDFDIHANNEQAIRISCYYNYSELVKWLVDKGADIHTHYEEPLRSAVNNSNLDLVIYLVDKGAKIDIWDYFPLTLAAGKGEIEILTYFLSIANHTNKFMINWAAAENRIETLIRLLYNDQCTEDAKIIAARYGHLSIVKMLGYSYQSLATSIKYSQSEVLEYLINVSPKEDLFLANVLNNKDISMFEIDVNDFCYICFDNVARGIELNCCHIFHSSCLLTANLPYCSYCLRKLIPKF